jgi:excisionase family DNA binding protein
VTSSHRRAPPVRPSSPLLTAAEAARYLTLSESWVRHAAGAGLIPHVRLGRCVRFRVADLDELIDAGYRAQTVAAAAGQARLTGRRLSTVAARHARRGRRSARDALAELDPSS